jgi:hypothetical protein
MTRPCARCEWQPGDVDAPLADQKAEHARESGHLLCIVCTRSLLDYEQQTCESCLTHTRELLAGIGLMYDELPRHLGHVSSRAYGSGPVSSDGRPLPGGDVLVLLANGSEGFAEDALTTKDGDPTPVAYELGWWHEEWQDCREERVTDARPRSAVAIVRQALGYLEVHARWAAAHHPGFDEFAADVRKLHTRMEVATGRVRQETKANASCFDCGGDLVRRIDGDGMEEDHVTCVRCRRQYDQPRYLLALAGRREEGLAGWVTVAAAAAASKRSKATLQRWLGRHVAWATAIAPREPTEDDPRVWLRVSQIVWYPDVDARAKDASDRATRRAAASA